MTRVKKRTKDGYVRIIGDDDSRDGFPNECYEHRHVIAKLIGGPLPDLAVVHHRNRRRHVNDADNLLLIPNQALHVLVHSYKLRQHRLHERHFERWCLLWMAALQHENGAEVEHRTVLTGLIDAMEHELADLGKTSSDVEPQLDTYLGQYFDVKTRYPSHLVFIQRGHYYDVFDGDARTLHRLFGWKTYDSSTFGLLATGTGIENERVFNDLEALNVPHVIVAQVSEVRVGRVLDRGVVGIFDGE